MRYESLREPESVNERERVTTSRVTDQGSESARVFKLFESS